MGKGRELAGTVEKALPRGLYRVRCDSGDLVTVSIGQAAKHALVRVLPGDRVLVEVSPLDPTRGRVTTRMR